MGLLALLISYLLLGKFIKKHPTNNLLKNHLGPLYYKSRLSNVRNTFTGASDWYLKDKASLLAIIKWVLVASTRPGETKQRVVTAFPGSGPTVLEYVAAVLKGTGDPLFEASKNPYSDEIAPYPVGKTGEQTPGFAVESRKTAPPGGFTYPEGVPTDTHPEPIEAQSHRPVGDWPDIAVELWKYLRRVNDIE
jgi:hypothetical protein